MRRLAPAGSALLLAVAARAALAGPPPVPVAWLPATPVIDGLLDDALRAVPAVPLADVRGDVGAGPASAVTVRLAYDARSLYLFVATDQDTLVCRDRAYQNGDGFHLALVVPTSDGSPSREFQVLGFSPLAGTDDPRFRAFAWYRNVDLAMTPLAGAATAWRSARGASSYELLLPWSAVTPLHPWLTPDLGINICWVQAASGTARVAHFLLHDGRLQSEQSPRLWVPLAFAPPVPAAEPAVAVAPARGHLEAGERPLLKAAALAATAASVAVMTEIARPGSALVATAPAWVDGGPQPRPQDVPVETAPLPPGDYALRWRATGGDWEGGFPLSVLPPWNAAADSLRLALAAPRLRPGALATLAFRVADIDARLRALRPYEAAPGLAAEMEDLAALLGSAESGARALAARRGVLRRAYRSALDGTLQPYTVRVPADYDSSRQWPLLVWLHGSGVDDRGQLDEPHTPDGWLELAPNGRGTSHAWSTDGALADVREALADVEANYAVDPSRIVLAGFSMGGYGVYRVQLAMPGRFRALAVFSGDPDLANRWSGGGHPDFRDPANLAVFRGLPIFIFHGARDRNCPVENTEALVTQLRAAGADVQFVLEPEAGHERPGEEVRGEYREWLDGVCR